MEELRYKAFISYSHQDQKWGRWLQRSLESYRVPRRLVGTEGRCGAIPARIAPVFRDREDLSSAADLTSSVKEELAASETLVVICSPAAAASRWVNEEVAYFRELGRGDRILALIVDGDPKSEVPSQRCFPPAMIRNVDGQPFEPLAADARKWADGKALARLKLVAGILGIRLDDLRQRDMQRKHRRWMISASGAMAVALLTTVLAVVAITARNQAENRRQHAENLVDYMVDDLKQKLDEVGRLDILEGVGDEVSKYLETLDPREETEESLLQKVKVWRQLGEVSMGQGKLDDAMTAFNESRDLTRELLRRNPEDTERIYEIAQAEFWVGYVYIERGAFEEARAPLDRYLEYADHLVALEPNDPEWIMEKSYAHGNIAALITRRESDDVDLALKEIIASVELNRRAIELAPENSDYFNEYGHALAWQADTQLLLCDLGGALQSRQENLRIAREALERVPADGYVRERYAYSLSGLANVANQIGLTEYAADHLKESAEVLGQLYLIDRSNVEYHWDQLKREEYIAKYLAESGELDEALRRLASLYDRMRAVLEAEGAGHYLRRKEWVGYLLLYAEVAWRAGETQRAEQMWLEAVERIASWIQQGVDPQSWSIEIVVARFLHWHYDGPHENGRTTVAAIPDVTLDEDRAYISCSERGALVLQALLRGDGAKARRHTDYLLSRGYYEPGFVRICRHYDLCHGYG